jgi:hypothetical protein
VLAAAAERRASSLLGAAIAGAAEGVGAPSGAPDDLLALGARRPLALTRRRNKRDPKDTPGRYFSFHLSPGWLSKRQFRAGGDPAHA